MVMTDDQIRALMEAATPGPWQYQGRQYDDWGVVRGASPDKCFVCQARDVRYTEKEYLDYCRGAKIDPWIANARLIAAAPDLAAGYLARGERIAELEAQADLCIPINDPAMVALVEAARAVNHDNLHGNGLEGFRKNRDRLNLTLAAYTARIEGTKL